MQHAFEFGHLVTDSGGRQVQLLSCQGKAFAAGNGFKGLQGGERRNHG